MIHNYAKDEQKGHNGFIHLKFSYLISTHKLLDLVEQASKWVSK